MAENELVRAMELFWSKDDSDDNSSLVELKGLNAFKYFESPKKKNLPDLKNVHAKKGKENSGKTRLVSPSALEYKYTERKSRDDKQKKAKTPNEKTGKNEKNASHKSDTAETTNRKASFKDLCATDKQRIAILIQELAKTDEECSVIKHTLTEERNKYEKQMRELIEQQDEIIKQRQVVQEQLLECQKLVEGYQKYLMEHEKHSSTPSKQKSSIPRKGKELDGEVVARPAYSTPSQRPFTTMIDKLLAQGNHNNLADNNIHADNGGVGLTKERLFGVGPLEAPVMSSTQRSDMTNGHVQDAVKIKAEEFQPLQADQRSTSTTSSHYSDQDMTSHNHGLPAPIKKVSKDDSDFVKYYRKLSPEERKRQLIAQREALVQEQQRLKAILLEQEALLRAKQEQLHSQQQLQKHRLHFFEQMGFFPNLGLNGHTNYENHQGEGQVEQPHQQQGQHQQHVQQHVGQYAQQTPAYLPYPTPYVPSSGQQAGPEPLHGAAYHHNTAYPASAASYMPYQHENMAPHYGAQQYHQPAAPHMRPWTMSMNGGMLGGYPRQDLCSGGYDMDYMGHQSLQPPMEVPHEAPQLSQSMENINFLHRHGVHASSSNREHRKGLELPELRSAATSPLRPVCQDRQAPSVPQYSDEAEQPHYTILESPQQASRHHNHYQLLNGNSGCEEKQGKQMMDVDMGQTCSPSCYPPRTPASAQPTQPEHGAYLLDLVEEVESLHNSSHGYMGSPQSPGGVHDNNMAIYSNGYSEKSMSEYEEESRVLEEVFFVK